MSYDDLSLCTPNTATDICQCDTKSDCSRLSTNLFVDLEIYTNHIRVEMEKHSLDIITLECDLYTQSLMVMCLKLNFDVNKLIKVTSFYIQNHT